MDKKTTDLTITELTEALPKMGDDDLRAAFVAETTTDGHTERAGAIEAIKAEADSRGELEAITRPVEPKAAAAKPVKAKKAKAAAPKEKAKEPETDAERAARLQAASDKALLAEIEADPRKAILRIFRSLEAISNHLNFPLPR